MCVCVCVCLYLCVNLLPFSIPPSLPLSRSPLFFFFLSFCVCVHLNPVISRMGRINSLWNRLCFVASRRDPPPADRCRPDRKAKFLDLF